MATRYRIEFSPLAARQISKLPRDAQVRLGRKIDSLAADPRPSGVKKLAGADSTYRLRVGDYRIIYEVHDKVLVVVVLAVGHRSAIYRKLSD